MLSYTDALEVLNTLDTTLPTETISIEEAWNRVLGEEIYSDINMPAFDKSAMDGFACRKEDLDLPLKVIGTIYAGSSKQYTIDKGECVKIMTGAPVPKDSDIVIMLEDTKEVETDLIQFSGKKSKTNICLCGEDVKKGEHLLSTGTLLLAHHIAVLASAGYHEVKVFQQPRIALVSTGSELVAPGTTPTHSQLRNSNAYNLLAQLKEMNIKAFFAGIVPDEKERIKSLLSSLIEEYDVVILTGGASVGEHDYVPSILQDLRLELKFDRVGIQPGKPVSFACSKNKFCLGLSGNPVSSYLQFEVLAKSFIYKMMGHKYNPPIHKALLAKSIRRKNASRLKFVPVQFNTKGFVEEIRFNGSAHIVGLSSADGFALFPAGRSEMALNTEVDVLLI